MSTAPRMSIAFTAPQMAYLKAEAERLGISVADLVRRIVDQHREGLGRSRADKFTTQAGDLVPVEE